VLFIKVNRPSRTCELKMSRSSSVKFLEDAVRIVDSFFGYPHLELWTSACPAFVDAICDDNKPAAAKHAMCRTATRTSGRERLNGAATLVLHTAVDRARLHSALGAVIALRRMICC
jgi:hypothetical protein